MNDKQNTNRKLAAIMFADIVSYSRLMGANEAEALKLVKDFDSISIPIVEKYDGKVIKKNGDQIFCEFSSAKNAVDASLLIQEKLHNYNDSRPIDFKLEVRIGIHIGDVIKENNDIFGDGVNVAARIQPLAAPGGISISGTVSEALSSHPEYKLIAKGEQELKNIVNKHSIFNVETGYETGDICGGKAKKSKLTNPILYLFPIIAISIFVIYYYNSDSQVVEPIKNTIFISKIMSSDFTKSNFKPIDIIRAMDGNHIKDTLINDNSKLININNKQALNVYDEVLSNLDYNNTKYSIETHYDYEDKCKSLGNAVINYSEESFFKIGMALAGGGDNFFDALESYYDGSLFEITDKFNYDATIAPIVYKLYNNNNKFSSFYAVTLLRLEFSSEADNYEASSDVSVSLDGDTFISREESLSKDISFHINEIINQYINSSDESYIKITAVTPDEYIFKFSKDYKNKIKERMILSAERYIIFSDNTNNDSLSNVRRQDLTSYKSKIDKDKGSTYYNDFYMKNNPAWSQEELDRINNNEWLIYSEGAFSYPTYTKIKVVEVYDSTASAILYSKENPYIDLKVGDYLIY